VVPESMRDFFVASASVAGALIGLLFVAISVASERGQKIGPTAIAVAVGGLGFVVAALLSLTRQRQVRRDTLRDALFLLGLVVSFVFQLLEGAVVIVNPRDADAVNTIAVLVVVCFLIGIARAWELIGGPSFGITDEVSAFFRGRKDPQA
jgi:hypothetical protein